VLEKDYELPLETCRQLIFGEDVSFLMFHLDCNVLIYPFYIPVSKFSVNNIFLINKMNAFIQRGCIKLIKSDMKDIFNGTKDYKRYVLCSGNKGLLSNKNKESNSTN